MENDPLSDGQNCKLVFFTRPVIDLSSLFLSNATQKAKRSAVAEMSDRGHNRHRPRKGGGASVPLSPTAVTPSNIMWPAGTYQAVSSSIQPFGHNSHEPKTGGCAPFRGAATPSNTTSPRPRFTSAPSGILIHPAVRPQRTLAENEGLCPFRGGELGPHLTQCRVDRGLPPYKVAS